MGEDIKPLTEAQRNHLAALNAAFLQAKQRLDEFIAYLRAEHDAPAPQWTLKDIRVGFQKVADAVETEDQGTRKEGRRVGGSTAFAREESWKRVRKGKRVDAVAKKNGI